MGGGSNVRCNDLLCVTLGMRYQLVYVLDWLIKILSRQRFELVNGGISEFFCCHPERFCRLIALVKKQGRCSLIRKVKFVSLVYEFLLKYAPLSQKNTQLLLYRALSRQLQLCFEQILKQRFRK